MTTVAAIATGSAVHMAADTMTCIYERRMPLAVRKIVRVKVGSVGHALLGIAGNGALGGSLTVMLRESGLPGPTRRIDRWAASVAKQLTEQAAELGCVTDSDLEGTLLLGFGGALWTLTHHLAIPHHDGIAAVGSGEGLAIGAIDALLAAGVDPQSALSSALRIAIGRDKHSGGDVMMYMQADCTTRPRRVHT